MYAHEGILAIRRAKECARVGGREQLAIEAFVKSMEIVPKTLAENAGLARVMILRIGDVIAATKPKDQKGGDYPGAEE